jgi:hypothetical protein
MTEIEAWGRLMRFPLEPFEVKTVLGIDALFIKASQKAE